MKMRALIGLENRNVGLLGIAGPRSRSCTLSVVVVVAVVHWIELRWGSLWYSVCRKN
jgi:hypothetical protein